ncbi:MULTISPECIES: hypothetical protein [unclassified Colwellia]|uniref:hypothetical protein n=1 Tax=unclassified Colwellia TaxID=196834 RepID=UPI0015F6541D|nr:MULTISPECIES: hypothetical protein [unclassified Colwellia]MBA6231427.1 hypothetical protein [Colwellia sp. MB02u-7]MBA6235610.1 hypothetical protein [Colwellia sp. MB02u-11]MBA6256019.1 hypothetical protein [Colwellia sp. MB3u-28]MBA6260008.1 hypothetical protein [Colwellia sp. MB3u-41]MBA6298952.1 hypothetical protein [Colwellia sp. MB3u-22]
MMKLSSQSQRNIGAALASPVILVPVISIIGNIYSYASNPAMFNFEELKLVIAFSVLTLMYAYPITIVFGSISAVVLQNFGLFKLQYVLPISLIPTLYFHLRWHLSLNWLSIFMFCSLVVALTFWLIYKWLK